MKSKSYASPLSVSAFTLIELLVVIAIIAVLAAILFPVFARAREKARQSMCTSNLKQLTSAIQIYVQDYDELYPYWNWGRSSSIGTQTPNHLESLWINAIFPYVKAANIYRCPSSNSTRTLRQSLVWDWTIPSAFESAGIAEALKDSPVHYGMSEPISMGDACKVDGPCSQAGLERPANMLLLADLFQGLASHMEGLPALDNPTDPKHNFIITRVAYANSPDNCYDIPENCGAAQVGTLASFGNSAALFDTQTRHSLGSVISFVDGHVKWMPAHQIVYDLFIGQTRP